MPVNYINLADIDRSVQQSQLADSQLQNAEIMRQDRLRGLERERMAEQQGMMLRDIYKQGAGDLNKTRDALYKGGFYEQGAALDKQLGESAKQKADVAKTEFDMATKRLGLIGNGMKFIVDNPTKENALMTFGQLRKVGVLNDDQYNEFTANIPDDPNIIRNGAESLFRSALDAKDQLGKVETRDTGGTLVTQQIDPITGQVKPLSTVTKTQTPDSIASNERIAKEGRLNRALQREKMTSEQIKPSAGEKLTEGMRSTAQYAQRMVAAENLLGDTVEQKPGIGEATLGFAGETAANLARSPDRQKALQAQRDWVRAKLRKESGAVIGIDEMENEIRTYFPQIGDSDEVIYQKKLARQQATQGMIESSGAAYTPPVDPIMPKNEPMPNSPKAPTLGTVKNGYVYIGGNPADSKSWKKK